MKIVKDKESFNIEFYLYDLAYFILIFMMLFLNLSIKFWGIEIAPQFSAIVTGYWIYYSVKESRN